MSVNVFKDVPIDKYYNIASDVFDRIVKWKHLKNNINTKLRLLFLECRRNLEILSIIELKKTNGIATDDEDFKTIIENLETEILEMIFLEGEKNNKLYELLRKQFKYKEMKEDNDKEDHISEKSVTVLYAIVYLYVKIYTLKKIITLEKKGNALKKIYYRARLRNIKESFINIVQILSQHKEIKEILKYKD